MAAEECIRVAARFRPRLCAEGPELAGWTLRPGASPSLIEIVVLFAAATLVFASRLYLQVHFPSDVIAGAMLATLWVLLLRRLPAWREKKQ